jgi:hypothetical protein
MFYQVKSDDGGLLNAHFQLKGSSIWFLSRGGTKGVDAANSDYGPALRLLLERMNRAGISIEGVWVDSTSVQGIPLEERRILSPTEWPQSPQSAFTLLSKRMKPIGQTAGAKSGGNSTRKLRIDLSTRMHEREIVDVLGAVATKTDLRSLDRLPTETLQRVTSMHVWTAVQKLLQGHPLEPFGPSTDYDLVADDGQRFPPKAVFGIAASDALGFQVVPDHFTGGVGTPCFRILEDSGYLIVPKDASPPSPSVPPSTEDESWAEGNRKLVAHLRRERAKGLSQAKKAEFRAEHGALRCERCGKDPVKEYGPHGEACIEVHHKDTQLKDMQPGHRTTLDELQCLCANCHRIVHKELKLLHAPADKTKGSSAPT